MDAVAHRVCREGAPDLGDDLVVGGDLGESEGQGGCAQPREVLLELEDTSAVQAKPLPDGVASLNHRVERADARLVAVHQSAIDVDDQVAVAFVEAL